MLYQPKEILVGANFRHELFTRCAFNTAMTNNSLSLRELLLSATPEPEWCKQEVRGSNQM